MVMKATTPPTIPMMTESMLVRPLDCLGWAVGKVGLVVGSKMISGSDSVGLVLGGEKVTSTVVVVGVPSFSSRVCPWRHFVYLFSGRLRPLSAGPHSTSAPSRPCA